MNRHSIRTTLLALTAAALLPFGTAQARPGHDDDAWSRDSRVQVISDSDRDHRKYDRYDHRHADHRPVLHVRDRNAPLLFRVGGSEYVYLQGRFYARHGRHLRLVEAPVRVEFQVFGKHVPLAVISLN